MIKITKTKTVVTLPYCAAEILTKKNILNSMIPIIKDLDAAIREFDPALKLEVICGVDQITPVSTDQNLFYFRLSKTE